MHEGVSDILVARARELDGVSRPVTVSFVVHVVFIAALLVMPSAWFAAKNPDKLMLISLGAGATGPDASGLTALGGKKVEEVAPPKRSEPITPTAPKSTAMTEPVKSVTKTPPPKSSSKPEPQTMPTSKPSTGAQITPGNAVAATTTTGLGVGLSTGGQGGESLDSNWCCPDWTNVLRSSIAATWNEHVGVAGVTVVKFVVSRDGSIGDVTIEKSSGLALLDSNAKRAVVSARLPPLPSAYEPNRLTITLTFPYIK